MTPGPAPFPAPARDDRTLAALIATLVFVAIVAAAVALGAAGSVRTLDRSGTRLTVQVPAAAAGHALDLLRAAPGVARAVPVDRATLLRLLRPWLGEDVADLPIPALIDVDLDDDAALPAIEARLRGAVAVIRIDRADRWLAPAARVLRRLLWASAALALLPVIATPMLAARAARHMLARQQEGVALVRTLGATDRQLAAPFRRRIAATALAGAAVGGSAALAIVLLIRTMLAGPGSELIAAAAAAPRDWAVLAALPVALALLAIAAGRHALDRALESPA